MHAAEPGGGRRSASRGARTGTRIEIEPETIVDEDLGAVGTVGVPVAVGVAFDAEAVVDLGVVAFAEQAGVVQAGLPPSAQARRWWTSHHQVGASQPAKMQPPSRCSTARRSRRGQTRGAADVEGQAVGVEDDAGDVGVAGGPAGAGGGQGGAEAGLGGAGAAGGVEQVGRSTLTATCGRMPRQTAGAGGQGGVGPLHEGVAELLGAGAGVCGGAPGGGRPTPGRRGPSPRRPGRGRTGR